MQNSLPRPDPQASSHSDQVKAYIAEHIQQQGPMTFAQFMQFALYAPGLGYYRSGAQKFGRGGDFTTAPELSPLFSQCVAMQCAEILEQLGQGDILEIGAGSGALAVAMLQQLEQLQQLPERYLILELSAELKERQRLLLAEKASHLLPRVQWLNQLPNTLHGVVIANEVMDAMPVHKFKQEQALQEYYVDYQQDHFLWALGPLSNEAIAQNITELNIDFLQGYESEINLLLPAWIASLAKMLQQGACLLIDYGFPRHEYYHADRYSGTIMCHFRHHAHSDPLILPGIQDITAHVDFTLVAEAAVREGLAVAGFTHQAAFLINCGLVELINQVADPAVQMQINNEVKMLTLPSEMGELFKVIALTKNYNKPLCGFTQMNQLGRL